jgi:hypothetical protein
MRVLLIPVALCLCTAWSAGCKTASPRILSYSFSSPPGSRVPLCIEVYGRSQEQATRIRAAMSTMEVVAPRLKSTPCDVDRAILRCEKSVPYPGGGSQRELFGVSYAYSRAASNALRLECIQKKGILFARSGVRWVRKG